MLYPRCLPDFNLMNATWIGQADSEDNLVLVLYLNWSPLL